MKAVLEIRNLTVTAREGRRLLDDVSLCLNKGEIIGLTGESGCGKTTLIKSMMGFLRTEQLSLSGQILLDARNITALPAKEHAALRGTTFALIPQSPMTAFDPSWKIGAQMEETLRIKLHLSRKEAMERAEESLSNVNLADTKRILGSYPGQLSGGMLQRVAVALVFALEPEYILADEPTSALDEENCDIITDLLLGSKKRAGVLLVSHDARTLKRAADRLLVMHDGKIVDAGETDEVFTKPQNLHTIEFVRGAQRGKEDVWLWERS